MNHLKMKNAPLVAGIAIILIGICIFLAHYYSDRQVLLRAHDAMVHYLTGDGPQGSGNSDYTRELRSSEFNRNDQSVSSPYVSRFQYATKSLGKDSDIGSARFIDITVQWDLTSGRVASFSGVVERKGWIRGRDGKSMPLYEETVLVSTLRDDDHSKIVRTQLGMDCDDKTYWMVVNMFRRKQK